MNEYQSLVLKIDFTRKWVQNSMVCLATCRKSVKTIIFGPLIDLLKVC